MPTITVLAHLGYCLLNSSGNLFGGAIDTSLPANSNYWKRDNLFSLRYCNWNKDMFMGILPNSQFGDIAVVDVTGVTGYSDVRIGSSGRSVQNYAVINSDSSFLVKPSSAPSSPIPAGTKLISGKSSLSASFNILALRQAEALQKYCEITQSVDTNYRDQIKAHFGVNVPASDSHMAQYIGGIARNPRNFKVYFNMSSAYCARYDLPRAIKALEEAKKGTVAELEETAEATPTVLFLLPEPKTTLESPELEISETATSPN